MNIDITQYNKAKVKEEKKRENQEHEVRLKEASVKKEKLEQLKMDIGRWATRIKIAGQTKNGGNTELHSQIQNKTIKRPSPNFTCNIEEIELNNLSSAVEED